MKKNLEKEIAAIKARNLKVEADKAWETSKTRRGMIAAATYFIFVWFLWLIKAENYWLNALIPAGAYVISTLTLPFIRKWWVEKIYKK